MKSRKMIFISLMSLLALTVITLSVIFINKSIKAKEVKYFEDATKIKVDLFLAGALSESMAIEYINTYVGILHHTITIKEIPSAIYNFPKIVNYLQNQFVIEGRFEAVDDCVKEAVELLKSTPPLKYSKTHSDLKIMYKLVCDYQSLVIAPNLEIKEYKAEVGKLTRALMQINNELELTLLKQNISMDMQLFQTTFNNKLQNYYNQSK